MKMSSGILGFLLVYLSLSHVDAEEPTSLPTSLPSSMPSTTPSTTPSDIPTGVPSSLPTYFPSDIPTTIPTTHMPTPMPTPMPTFQCVPGESGQNPDDLKIQNTTNDGGEIIEYIISTPQHPYENCTIYSSGETTISFSDAEGYSFKFDSQTSSEFEHDYLTVYEGHKNGPVLLHRSGKQEQKYCIDEYYLEECNYFYPWSFTKIASSKGLYIEFSTDSTISDWGISVAINKSSVELLEPNIVGTTATWSIPSPYADNTIYSSGHFTLESSSSSATTVTAAKSLRDEVLIPWYAIDFQATNTEGGYDFVKIYEDTSEGNLLYMRSGGYGTWPIVYLPSTSGLQIIFTTDAHKEGETDDHPATLDMSMTVDDLPEDTEPSGYTNRKYSVAYNGVVYSTIADVPIDIYAENSQSFYMRIPYNWHIAQDTPDTRYIIQNHHWNTQYVVLNDGFGIGTKSTGDMAGEKYGDNMLEYMPGFSLVKCRNAPLCQILIMQDAPSTYSLFGFDDVEEVFRNMAIAFMVIFFVFATLSFLYRKGYLKDLCRGRYGGAHQPSRQHRWEAEEAIDNRRVGEISMNPLARNASNNATTIGATTTSQSRGVNSMNTGDNVEEGSNVPSRGAVVRADNSRARRDPFVSQAIQEGGFSPGPQPKNNSNVPKISIRPPKSSGSATVANPTPTPAATFGSNSGSNPSIGGDLLDLPTSAIKQQTSAVPVIAPVPSRSQMTLSREWTEKYSQQHKRKFWKNNVTGKSTWEDPFKQQSSSSASTSTALVSSDSQSSEPDLL